MLLTGPDLNNSLLCALLCLRVAILADIQQMFHNVLQFLWHQDNDLSKVVYGLRRAMEEGDQKYGADTFMWMTTWYLYCPKQRLLPYSNVHKPHSLSRTSACISLCQTVKQSLVYVSSFDNCALAKKLLKI